MTNVIDDEAVLTLAHAQGHDWVDREVAGRIAAAATVAVRSVAAAVSGAEAGLLPNAAAEFAATLDSLAEPQS
jgi:hypothetical protein